MKKKVMNIVRWVSAGLTITGIIAMLLRIGTPLAEAVSLATATLGTVGLSTALGVELYDEKQASKKRSKQNHDVTKSFDPVQEKGTGVAKVETKKVSQSKKESASPIYGGPQL